MSARVHVRAPDECGRSVAIAIAAAEFDVKRVKDRRKNNRWLKQSAFSPHVSDK